MSIRIFVTGKHDQGSEYGSINSSEGEGASHKERAPSLLSHPAVCVAHGRPDLPALLREEVDANSGRMSVTGKPTLVSSLPLFTVADPTRFTY